MTPAQLEFLNSLIGLPWVSGAKGPDAYDCWGLAQVVQLRVFGRTLPDIRVVSDDLRTVIREVATTPARRSWVRAEGPRHGQLVELSSGLHPYHVGVYLDADGGGVVHSQRPAGVCFDRIVTLQASGWRRFVFNDWAGDC